MTRYEQLKQQIDEFKKNTSDRCLVWPFVNTLIHVPGRMGATQSIQRVAFFYYYEIGIEENYYIYRECSNPNCFNPLHSRKLIPAKNSTERSRRTKTRNYAKGLCIYCGKRPHIKGIQRCEECRQRDNKRSREYLCSHERRERRLQRKKLVMNHYGGKCTCCGEEIIEFLTIDHIDGNGGKHRKEIFGDSRLAGQAMYRWLIRNDFPDDNFQVLCFNCNVAKGVYDTCPHQKIAES